MHPRLLRKGVPRDAPLCHASDFGSMELTTQIDDIIRNRTAGLPRNNADFEHFLIFDLTGPIAIASL
jgi:hypothetical protein